jgi:shikimate dehydrogenase
VKKIVIVGYPLGHTLSPIMQNAALDAMGLRKEYHYDTYPISSEELPRFIQLIGSGTIEGANITIPYKSQIMSLLSCFSPESIAIGAVNTLYRDKEQVVGCNTDVIGFIEALKENNVNVRNLRATILGAGGAAKAVAYALVKEGVERLEILNRTPRHARALAESLRSHKNVEIDWDQISNVHERRLETGLIVNCTPVGMSGHSLTESPLPKVPFSKNVVVMDLIYNPLQTRLLREAEKAGCKTIDGVSMLVHQGAAAFEIWTGERPPINIMRKAVLESLRGDMI